MGQIAIFEEKHHTYYYDLDRSGGWPRVCMAVVRRWVKEKRFYKPGRKPEEPEKPDTDDFEALEKWVKETKRFKQKVAHYHRNKVEWARVQKALDGDFDAAVALVESSDLYRRDDLSDVDDDIPKPVYSQTFRIEAHKRLLRQFLTDDPPSKDRVQGHLDETTKTTTDPDAETHPFDEKLHRDLVRLEGAVKEAANHHDTLESQDRIYRTLAWLGEDIDWKSIFQARIDEHGSRLDVAKQWFREVHGREPKDNLSDNGSMDHYVKKIKDYMTR